jgi:glucan-binding YG repeat protein
MIFLGGIIKIKLSRSQWELIGKKTGWMKSAGVFWGPGQGPQDTEYIFETDKQRALELLKFNGKRAWLQISDELKKDPDIVAAYQTAKN